jgi:hypothetical protein
MKNVREWKFVEGENKLEFSWFVRDKQSNNGENLYLYCTDFEHVQVNYQPLSLLRDICLVPDTDIVYALVKQDKNYIKIRYCLKLSNNNRVEFFTELCASIVEDIEKGNVSLFIFIFVSCIIYIIMLIFYFYLTQKCFILFLQNLSKRFSHMLVGIYSTEKNIMEVINFFHIDKA